MLCSLLVFLFTIGPSAAFAIDTNVDLALQGSYRSNPKGGGLSATAGYSILFWGSAEDAPWFGFVRGGLDLSSAISHNASTGFVELFPVSFVGFKLGHERSSNAKEYDGFDCLVIDCTGARRQDYAEAKVALPVGQAFVILKERAEWHGRSGNDPRRFAEPTSGLTLDVSGGERVRVSQLIVGAKVNDRSNMLVGSVRYEGSRKTGQDFVAGTYREGEFTVFAGLGYWRTFGNQDPSLNFLVQGAWTPLKGWAFF